MNHGNKREAFYEGLVGEILRGFFYAMGVRMQKTSTSISPAEKYHKCKEIIAEGKKVLELNGGKDIWFVPEDDAALEE